MKKVLYLTNIESPYRVRFFNELNRYCDLTVLYERCKAHTRNEQWAKSIKGSHKAKYLRGIRLGGENAFSFGMIKEIFAKYDTIIVGCINSPCQMLAILTMRLFHIPYVLNLDGEIFCQGNTLKDKLKRFFLKGASAYLVAGEKSAESVAKVVGNYPVIPYWFSSLSNNEIERNARCCDERNM